LSEIKEQQAENLKLSNELKDASEEIVVKSDKFESKPTQLNILMFSRAKV